MYRITIRFSINSDQNSLTRNNAANALQASGFMNTGTGTWNSGPLTETQVAAAINAVTNILGNTSTNNPGSQLDHYWVNVDRLP